MKPTMIVKKIKPSLLSAQQTEAMWLLYESFYEAVNRETFLSDLAQKQLVYVGFDGPRIVAFSTTKFYHHTHNGKKVTVLFTGDTIVHPEFWGTGALHRAIAKDTLIFRLKNIHLPCYWNLIASGNKTYLTLSKNFPTYWPRFDRQTPNDISSLMDSIGAAEFPKSYNPKTQVVEMTEKTAVFKQQYAPFDAQTLSKPEISYFVKVNPGFQKGDELFCLGVLDTPFILATMRKCMDRTLPKGTLQYAPYAAAVILIIGLLFK